MAEKKEIVIIDAVRTPGGRFLGSLSAFSAPKLGAIAIKELIKRTKMKSEKIESVIMGNVLQAGIGQNPARQAAIAAGLPHSVNTFTINKVCGSGLYAVISAAQAIQCNDANVVIAGGMESMSNAPFLLKDFRREHKLGDFELTKDMLKKEVRLTDSMVCDGLLDCYNEAHMGELAELLVEKYHISREEQDKFALESHRKAIKAIEDGSFKDEIIPIGEIKNDEGPRKDTSFEKLSQLKAAFKKDGTITAGNASALNDAAAALLITSAEKAKELGIKAIAKIEDYTSVSIDPKWYTLAPIYAVKMLMEKLKCKIDDFDLIELNEAFAVQSLAVQRELKIKAEKLNVNGGAIALGHPLGASGARILVTLIHALRRRKKEKGLATLCIGSGEALAMAVKII